MTTTTHSRRIRTATVRLGLGGAAGFWVTNFAISLTPIAAEYRTALGIAYLPMLGEALLAGLIIGFGVTVCLLRFNGTLPTSSPILKALLLSLVALIVATILVEIPPRLLTTTNTPPSLRPHRRRLQHTQVPRSRPRDRLSTQQNPEDRSREAVNLSR